MNTITCTVCTQPVRRGEAVIRANGHDQLGYHTTCYTIHRAVKDVVAAEVEAEERIARVGMTLAERMERAGLR